MDEFILPSDQPEAAHKEPASDFRLPSDIADAEEIAKTTPHPNGILSNSGDDSWASGAAKGAGTALIKGAANLPGQFGNIREFGHVLSDNAYGGIRSLATGETWDEATKKWREARHKGEKEFGSLQKYMPTGAELAEPTLERTGEYVPETVGGKMAQAGLETAVSAAGPGSGAAARGANGVKAFGSTIAPHVAGLNAVAGAAGEGATELTDSPGAGIAASIAAPLVTHGAAKATAPAVEAAKAKLASAMPYIESIPGIGRLASGATEREAGKKLLSYADDPEAFKSAVNPAYGPTKDYVLDGSPLTLGQRYGDTGILQAERSYRTSDPDFSNRFNALEQVQNQARADALGGEKFDGVSAENLGQHINDRHAAIEHLYERQEQALHEAAQRELERLGDRADPAEIGARLRAEIQKAREAHQKEVDNLYNKVDPENKMMILTTPLKDAVGDISGARTASTKWSPGLEQTLSIAREAPDVWPLRELRGLDRRLSDEMSAERRTNGTSESWHHLSTLKGKVKDAINNAVENQRKWENQAVTDGLITPEDTIEGRFGSLDTGNPVSREAATGTAERPSSQGTDASGNMSVPSKGGTAREGDGRSGNADRGQGLPSTVYYPGGNFPVRHEVVDLGDLITSHRSDFSENPNYPQELQPRDRSSKPAQDQVFNLANDLKPERLGPSAEANTGAPIVGPDGVVESGNGRTLAMQRNYAQGDKAGYRDWLESQGHNTEGMKSPILVARRLKEMTPQEREFFAHSANSSTGLQMGATEKAATDAKFLTPDVMANLTDGPVTAAGNRDFVTGMMNKIPVNERGGFMDANGNLSQAGEKRLQAALLHAAFGDDSIVSRGFESTDNNIRNITGALSDASGPWAKMRQAAKEGRIDAGHDVTEHLINAIKKVMRARDEGRPVAEVMAQKDLLAPDTAPLVESLLFKDGKVASRPEITARLNKYAQESLKNEAGPTLFGSNDLKPEDILRHASEAKAALEAEAGPTFETGAKEGVKTGPRPNMDPGAAADLARANKEYENYAQRYHNGRVGDTLKSSGFKDQYNVMDSSVPGRAVTPGDTGYQTAKAFITASRNSPSAVASMREQVLNHMRSAVKPEGAIHPAKMRSVVDKFSGAIKAIDEHSPGFAKSLENPASVAETMLQLAADKKQAVEASQKSLAGKFLGKTTPTEIEDAVGNIISSPSTKVSDVRAMIKKLPNDARAGMQNAAIDWIVRKSENVARPGVGDQPGVSYAKIDALLKNKSHILSEILTPEQMDTLRAVHRDLVMADRSVQANRVKGSPGTAMDIRRALTDNGQKLAGDIGKFAMFEKMGIPGVVLSHTLGNWFSKTEHSLAHHVKNALLDPAYARELLSKVPGQTAKQKELNLQRILMRSYLQYQGGNNNDRARRASGGRMGRKPMTADQLITALERTRKVQQKSTEGILEKSDAAVVRALHVANRQL